jgi:pullulanase
VTSLKERKPLRDLIVYELHIGDFTAEYRGSRAPLDAVCDNLDYLGTLGINAILFMPWTAWKDKDYDWGYAPFQYFAVEYAYANDANKPEEKISWLKTLITECHKRDIHVIMDGVYNHCDPIFPYRDFYLNQKICPYTDKDFGGAFPGLQDLDFANACTQAFIRDVCLYWISEFNIDGIRFDNTVNYYAKGDHRGLPDLLDSIQQYLSKQGQKNFSITLEHLDPDAAELVSNTKATSFWDNGLYEQCFSQLRYGGISPDYLSTLNDIRYVFGDEKTTTLYLSNHDHSSVAFQAGTWAARPQNPDSAAEWYRTQPHAIALLTSPGSLLIAMGQEFAADFYLPENDDGHRRVLSRPLHWKQLNDNWGSSLKGLY